SPALAGPHSADLRFTTNDPTDPSASVSLNGSAFDAPLAIDPGMLEISLSAGDRVELPLGFENTSTTDLDYSLLLAPQPVERLESALARLDENFSTITDLIPELDDFFGGVTGSNIIGGNQIQLGGGVSYPYRDGVVSNTNGRYYFTRKHPGLFVFAATSVQAFSILGNANTGYGQSNGLVLDRLHAGVRYRGFLKRNFEGSGPSVNQLVIVEDALEASTHEFPLDGESDAHSVDLAGGSSTVYYLRFGSADGQELSDELAGRVMDAFLSLLRPGWVEIMTPAGGPLAPAGSAVESIALDSSNLIAGDHVSAALARWENGTVQRTIEIPLTIHVSDAPGLDVDQSQTVEFGEAVAGLSPRLVTVPIHNAGTEPLAINSLATDSADFTVLTQADLVIAPQSTAEVVVGFAPAGAGLSTATLSFSTNDPTDPSASIALAGTAITSPLGISPSPIGASLLRGETAEIIASIENLSGSPLDWHLQAPPLPALEDVRTRFNNRYVDVAVLIPDRFSFTDGLSGSVIADGGSDMFNYGNRLGTNITSAIQYTGSGGILQAERAFGPNGRYMTQKHAGVFALSADLDEVDTFAISGFLGNEGIGSQELRRFEITHDGRPYTGFFKRTFGAPTPSVNHLVIVPDAPPTVTQPMDSGTISDLHIIEGLGESERLYYLLFSAKNGGRIEDAEAIEIMRAYLGIIGAEFPGLDLPAGGTLPGLGSSSEFSIRFDSSELPPGPHISSFELGWTENGGAHVAQIPVFLEIIDAPNLRVDQADLAFGSIQTNTQADQTLRMSNLGTRTLNVDSIAIESPTAAYSQSSPDPFTLVPGQSRNVTVTFDPPLRGDHPATLTINSDDYTSPITQVALAGNAFDPPILTELPASIDLSASPSEPLATDSFSFQNSGDRPLTWSISPDLTLGQPPTTLEETRQALDNGFASIISHIPNRFDFSGGTFGTSIGDLPDGIFRQGNTHSHIVPRRYTNGAITAGEYFTRKYPGLFVFAGDLDLSAGFSIGGDLDRTTGEVEGEVIFLTVGGTDYHGFTKRTYGPGRASVNHLIIVPAAPGNALNFPDEPGSDGLTLISNLGPTRLYHLLFCTADGGRVDTTQLTLIMRSFLENLAAFEIGLSGTAGTLQPGETATIDIEIPSTNHPAGSYGTELLLETNAPDNPSVSIPFTLEVLPPDLTVAPGNLAISGIESDAPATRSLELSSLAAAAGSWQARSTVPWVSVDPPSGDFPSTLRVTIDPSAAPPGAPEVSAIEVTSGDETIHVAVTTTALRYEIDSLVSDPDRPIVYAFRNGGDFADDAFIFLIDPFRGDELGRINLGSGITDSALHRDDQRLYIASAGSPELEVLDLATTTLEPPLTLDEIGTHISPAGPGRLVSDRFPGDRFQVIDTSDGSVIGSASTTLGLGDGIGADGYYYRLDTEAATLTRYDVSFPSAIDSIRSDTISPPPATTDLVSAQDAQRLFWDGLVLDQNLNYLGELDAGVFATSPSGDLVVTAGSIRRLSAGGAEISDLPFQTEVSAIWGSAELLVLFDPVNRQILTRELH
ncbi:MAG: choice-of-anchor D domain-containing protein, partial [Verrucomicrobiales bacterium]